MWKIYQVLEEHEYEPWLKRHLLAESSIENQEELLQDSAKSLETNLTLLGKAGHFWAFRLTCDRTTHSLLFTFRHHGDTGQITGGGS